jgi:4-amino-4-deoxy-L-arabinose transferase-like glycosyltransferase
MNGTVALGSAPSSAVPPDFANRFTRFLPWLGLAGILALFVFSVARLNPTNFFALMEDDSIYFSTAREIAGGRGYVMPNVPGTPAATKYPVLYPWILSWVWRLDPDFPSNLIWAVVLNVAFGMAYLAAAFIFLKRLKGLGDAAALLLTAFCAIHPVILALSAYLMSDIPFAALVLTSCILASQAVESGAKKKTMVFCGIVSGLSILLRSLGVPVALGLFAGIALRSGWKRSLLFAASVFPFLLVLAARSMAIRPAPSLMAASSCADSWRMTWLYYTSYTEFWKADIWSNHVFWPMLKSNVSTTLLQPGSYFIEPTVIRPALFAVVVLVILSAVAIRGLFRQAGEGGWRPVHFALALYLLPVAVWDYANAERFLIPFLPLIAAGLWVEARHLVFQLRSSVERKHGLESKATMAFFGLLGCVLIFGTTLSWRQNTHLLRENSRERAALLAEKRQAYTWLRRNTPVDSKILAYEDASLFLYSGRQSMRPTIFSPAGFYRPGILDSQLSCMVSSAKPIGAGYWLVADDDFGVEWEPAHSRGRSKEREIEATLRPLFHSTEGRVRIYGLDADGRPSR